MRDPLAPVRAYRAYRATEADALRGAAEDARYWTATDAERRAMDGELTALEAAWREAEEIAAIADALPSVRAASPPAAWRPSFGEA